jgi:hypothetical protein
MFKGHQFIKLLNDNWVLDLTEYQGYKVKLDSDNNAISYKEAFTVEVVGDEIMFNKKTRVPLKVLKEASNQIRMYEEELDDDFE